MKIFFYIILNLMSFELIANTLFDPNDDKKDVAVKYNGNSTLTLNHNYDFFCDKNMNIVTIYTEMCKGRAPNAILVTLNNTDLQVPVVIDLFDQNGASPEITNIITLDLDSDGNNELYIQVLNQPRHKGIGESTDTLEVFSYSDVIEYQADTGKDVKRLYYLEEEYIKILKDKEINFWDPLNRDTLKEILLSVKNEKININYLNSMGEYWYKKKNIDVRSTVHWYDKKNRNGYELSISYFEAAIKKDPKYIPSLSNLGIAYQKIGQYEEAIKAASKAIKLTNDSNIKASSHYNIAKAYEEKEEWSTALMHYQKASEYRKHKAYDRGIKRVENIIRKLDKTNE